MPSLWRRSSRHHARRLHKPAMCVCKVCWVLTLAVLALSDRPYSGLIQSSRNWGRISENLEWEDYYRLGKLVTKKTLQRPLKGGGVHRPHRPPWIRHWCPLKWLNDLRRHLITGYATYATCHECMTTVILDVVSVSGCIMLSLFFWNLCGCH